MIWRLVVRPLLFSLPPEFAHHVSMAGFHALMFPPISSLMRRLTECRDPALATRLWGLDFDNPVGLAAGFDKRGHWFNSLRHLGFSHIEIGTITGQQQPGNPRPRLFRLPRDQALVNRMGFNNDGADNTAQHLARQPIQCVLGINIGKSKVVELDQAEDDYRHSFELLFPYASYLTINVSSPNTPGLRELQHEQRLQQLIDTLQETNRRMAEQHECPPRPLLLKIAPDMAPRQLEAVADVARRTGISGLIATNTTIRRDNLTTPAARLGAIGEGGVSGGPLTQVSREITGRLYRASNGQIPIIGAGGIMHGEDAWQMIRHGASLVQVYTGFVYGGPQFVRRINRHLLQRLREEGIERIADATGLHWRN